jgi:hypothetical protein
MRAAFRSASLNICVSDIALIRAHAILAETEARVGIDLPRDFSSTVD